jgi:hypothetical protein
MKTRLEDLIATADRQLASRSYDASIDTYRMALGEPGAEEAGVAERLEAACRARDGVRGIVHAVEPPVPPEEPPADPPAAPREDPEPAPPQIDPEPEPPPKPIEERPEEQAIEPPTFQLVEPEPFTMERPERQQEFQLEVEKLSILNPTPPAEAPDLTGTTARLLIAFGIFIAVVSWAYCAR